MPFLEEIATFFENNINDDRILSYIYIYLGFQLIKCNKFEWVTILFYKVNDLAKSKKFIELEFTTLFNLGLINYSMNYFVEGIHNFETALKIIKINKLSIDYSLSIHENLALANINVLKFIHAFINTKEAISILTYKSDLESNLRINHLKVYLSFIIEIIQQIGSVIRIETKKNNSNINRKKNKDFEKECAMLYELNLENGFNRKQHIFDLYSYEFLRLINFLYNLTPEELIVLNEENKIDNSINNSFNKKENEIPNNTNNLNNNIPLKQSSSNTNLSNYNTNINNNGNKTTINNLNDTIQREFISYIQDKKRYRCKEFDYKNEMDLKKLYDILPQGKQEIFKTLNLDLVKRHVILKDIKDNIYHENLNYHPIHTSNLKDLLDNIKTQNKVGFLQSNLFNIEKNGDIFFDGIHDKDFHCFYALSKYIHNEENKKNRIIIDSLTRSNFMNRNISDVTKKNKNMPNMKLERFQNNKINPINKFPFEHFYNEMIKIPEYKAIKNIDYLLKKTYDEFESQNYLSYIIENPEIIKSFLYTDISNTDKVIKNFKENKFGFLKNEDVINYNNNLFNKTLLECKNHNEKRSNKSFIDFVREKDDSFKSSNNDEKGKSYIDLSKNDSRKIPKKTEFLENFVNQKSHNRKNSDLDLIEKINKDNSRKSLPKQIDNHLLKKNSRIIFENFTGNINDNSIKDKMKSKRSKTVNNKNKIFS